MDFFAVFDILFTFRVFEQLALALKNRVLLSSSWHLNMKRLVILK